MNTHFTEAAREAAKDGAFLGGIAIPAWIMDPTWIPPLLLWGGLAIMVLRGVVAIRDYRRSKDDK